MSAVSEAIVREFFELHGFLVRQQRKYVAPNLREDDDVDFFVLNPRRTATTPNLPFELGAGDIDGVARGIVVIKAWHTETFSPAMLTHTPEIFRFVEPAIFQQAASAFGGEGPLVKILVVPALPHTAKEHEESIGLLRAKGVDAVIPFRAMLGSLIEQTEANRNYQKSDLLQTIRILKNYDFFKEPQLELFKSKRGRSSSKGKQ